MTTHRINSTIQAEKRQLLTQRLDDLNQFKIDFGLARLHQVLDHLKLKQPAKQIITVGGTNGKGSTVAALCSLLTVKNKSFGAFTSPHLFSYNERFQVNGQLATDAEILTAFDAIDAAKGDIELSYFEYSFLTALLVFVAHQVDVIVLEVGMGGRLDAANALDANAVIITTVDIDHTEWLGDDVERIAAEKAGIIRSGQPVVYGDHHVPSAIKTKAAETSAELLLLDENYHIDADRSCWHYQYKEQKFTNLERPVLQGDWQLKNFSSALTALLSLNYRFVVGEVQQSIASWHLPGRLQTMQTDPLVLADVAHNRQSIQSLNSWLKANPIAGRTMAVFSVFADKEPANWLGNLDEVFDHWFIFQLSNERAMDMAALKTTMADHVSLFSQFDAAKQAYQMALATAKPADRIVVFGSFHVLAEVFK